MKKKGLQPLTLLPQGQEITLPLASANELQDLPCAHPTKHDCPQAPLQDLPSSSSSSSQVQQRKNGLTLPLRNKATVKKPLAISPPSAPARTNPLPLRGTPTAPSKTPLSLAPRSPGTPLRTYKRTVSSDSRGNSQDPPATPNPATPEKLANTPVKQRRVSGAKSPAKSPAGAGMSPRVAPSCRSPTGPTPSRSPSAPAPSRSPAYTASSGTEDSCKDSPVKDSPVKDSPVKDSPNKDSPVKDSPRDAETPKGPQEAKKDPKQMTREERKIAAYMKAFERMEKAQQRRQEMKEKKKEDEGEGRKAKGGRARDEEEEEWERNTSSADEAAHARHQADRQRRRG